jgi:hypothetical protein
LLLNVHKKEPQRGRTELSRLLPFSDVVRSYRIDCCHFSYSRLHVGKEKSWLLSIRTHVWPFFEI